MAREVRRGLVRAWRTRKRNLDWRLGALTGWKIRTRPPFLRDLLVVLEATSDLEVGEDIIPASASRPGETSLMDTHVEDEETTLRSIGPGEEGEAVSATRPV